MKLLFENWRQFLTEETDENGPTFPRAGPYGTPTKEMTTPAWIRDMRGDSRARDAALLKKAGLEMIRYLASGQHANTYEVRDLETQERLAAKITNHEPEREKYQWVKDHYDSFPPEVKKHFPEVYGTQEVEGKDIIVMEFLKKAPAEVTKDLFYGPGFGGDERLSTRREERFLSNPEAVKSIIDYCFKSQTIQGLIANIESMPSIAEMEAEVYEEWETSLDPGPPSSYLDYETAEFWETYGKKAQRLLNIICSRVLQYLPRRPAFPGEGLGYPIVDALVVRMREIMDKHVVPVHQSSPEGTRWAGAGEGVETVYPEAESLIKAMEYVAEEGFTPMDIHYENVMIRPGTDELVIADLGNFRLGFPQGSR